MSGTCKKYTATSKDGQISDWNIMLDDLVDDMNYGCIGESTQDNKLHDIENNEIPSTKSDIVVKVFRKTCCGLDTRIYEVTIKADMVANKVLAIAKNRKGDILGIVNSISADGPISTIRWHWEMLQQVRSGNSYTTDALNHCCSHYYSKQHDKIDFLKKAMKGIIKSREHDIERNMSQEDSDIRLVIPGVSLNKKRKL